MKPLVHLAVTVCLLASGCDDSKNPLSDPNTSKPDKQLTGVWWERNDGGDVVYHIGRAGEEFPNSVMRVIAISHDDGTVSAPNEYLGFATTLGDATYLNLVMDPVQVKRLNDKGWKAAKADSYTLLKYQFDGDALVVWTTDQNAKEKAIQDGKIQGVVEPEGTWTSRFTDTTENLARFVTEAGDSLWNTKEPCRLERVNLDKKP